MPNDPIVLASASASRAAMLADADVPFETVPAGVDEEAVRASLEAEGFRPRDVVDALAELKACRVSARMEGRLVLGADQILVCEGRIFAKPENREAAADQLRELRGREHTLTSAAVLARDGVAVWRFVDEARLRMRRFSEAFLERYLEAAGDAVFATVGAYRLEGRGVRLFEAVEGDFFTVLGLPLLPLLQQLRILDVLTDDNGGSER